MGIICVFTLLKYFLFDFRIFVSSFGSSDWVFRPLDFPSSYSDQEKKEALYKVSKLRAWKRVSLQRLHFQTKEVTWEKMMEWSDVLLIKLFKFFCTWFYYQAKSGNAIYNFKEGQHYKVSKLQSTNEFAIKLQEENKFSFYLSDYLPLLTFMAQLYSVRFWGVSHKNLYLYWKTREWNHNNFGTRFELKCIHFSIMHAQASNIKKYPISHLINWI